jgi:hypothetical protein
LKIKGAASSGSSFCSTDEAERIEQLIENLIRCIANVQVKALTNEAALAKSGQKITQLTTRCDFLETTQQELLSKITRLEHRLQTSAAWK